MRWIETLPCTTRTRSGFLWFPKKVNGETRWLEKANWIEVYWGNRGWVIEKWI